MNNKLDKLIVEQLKLDNKSTSEKLQVIEDELENVQKLCERLEFLQEQYQEEYDEENFKEWYNKCVGIIDDKLILTCQSSTEFGFDLIIVNLNSDVRFLLTKGDTIGGLSV